MAFRQEQIFGATVRSPELAIGISPPVLLGAVRVVWAVLISHCPAERIYTDGIELLLLPADNLLDGLFFASSLSIRPIRRQRIKRVTDCNDSRPEWNLVSLQITRIATTPKSLMM